MYSVRLVVDELKHGHRPIVTNLPLDLAALVAFLPECDVVRRVRLMSDSDLAEFYLHRGLDFETNQWVDGHRGPSGVPVIPPDRGVFYVIDESHLVFSQWDRVGRECLWYLSQHAKFGDDVLAVTQHADMLAKTFRVLAQDFTVLTNLAKVKVRGFRGPAMFLRRTFGAWPCAPGAEQDSGTFRLDVKGLGALYATAKGVGIHDRVTADKEARQSGPSAYWLPVAGVAALVLVGFGLHWGIGGFSKRVFGLQAAPAAVAASAAPGNAPALAPAVPVVPVRVLAEESAGQGGSSAPVVVLARAVANGRALVGEEWLLIAYQDVSTVSGFLADGRRWRLGSIRECSDLMAGSR